MKRESFVFLRSMFCDETRLRLMAGRGGGGLISFFRKKYQPKGGPDGGDGGDGGSIYLRGNAELNTLSRYRHLSQIQGENGEQGGTSHKHGRSGENTILEAPLGTRVIDQETQEILVELVADGQMALICRGGRGGYGNAHFTSSVRQAPRFAELGEPGEERSVTLELSLVADVGIIGLPSAGKSTFLSVVSDARPKIGDYPFTTTVPNLAVVDLDRRRSYTMCDLPGLIAGASEGRGLGHQFLKHVERNRVLLHLIDITSNDPVEDYRTIRSELSAYDPELIQRPTLIALSKTDMSDEEYTQQMQKLIAQEAGIPEEEICVLSSLTREGVKTALEKIWELREASLQKSPAPTLLPGAQENETPLLYEPHKQMLQKAWSLHEEADEEGETFYRVEGERISQIAIMTDMTNAEAVARLKDVLRKLGIEQALLRKEVPRGAKLLIGKREMEFQPKLIHELQRQQKPGEA